MDSHQSTICKQGILRKVRPKLKPKYFVLHRDGREQHARIEYFDSLKHFESRKKPKKSIFLKQCFSVNEFANSKVDHGMALYTKDDCFQIAFDNENDKESWLVNVRALHTTHRDSRPFYEHVWNVKIRERGLGKQYEGEYRLCLQDRNVMFIKRTSVDPTLNFPLEVIRHCGHTDNFFKLEVGRQATTGPGEFWLEVDDELIASNVHQTLITVMNSPKEDDMFRPASASLSSKDKTTFSKSGTTGGAYGTRGDRTRGGQSIRSNKQTQSNRNRSDSVDSKSTLPSIQTPIQPSISSSSIPSGGLRSVEDLPATFTAGGAAGAASLSSSLPDSRGSTPVRSLLADEVRMPRSAEQAVVQPQSYNDRSNSISSCSLQSWTSDLAHGSSTARALSSYDADVNPMQQQPFNSQTASSARLSVGKRPEKTQSYLCQSEEQSQDYLGMVPAAAVEDTPYFDMVPVGIKETPPEDSYFEMAPGAKAPVTGVYPSYMGMPASTTSKGPTDTDPYMDMVPLDLSNHTPLPYMDMAPVSTDGRSELSAADPYMDMLPASQSKDLLYVDMAPSAGSSPGVVDSGHLDRNSLSGGKAKALSSADTSYVDMSGGNQDGRSLIGLSADTQAWNPYIDMSGKDAHGFAQDGLRVEGTPEGLPLRHYSVGSRPTALQRPAVKEQYVEMCPNKDMSAKSQSVPHLMPLSLASNPDLTHLQDEYPSNHPTKPENLMMMSYDRPRTSSESHKQRPRGATWSANIRPRSSSHSQKHKLSTKSNSSRESLHSTCSDYIDMQVGARNRDSEYIEMAGRRHNRKHSHPMDTTKQSLTAKFISKLSPAKTQRSTTSSPATLTSSAKSNSYDALSERHNQSGDYVGFMPDEAVKNPQLAFIGRRMSQPHHRIDPFPELSNSSEEDVGMRSAASSFSSTRSSSSSRSSLARSDTVPPKSAVLYGGGSQLDPDSYVDCQQVSTRGGSGSSSASLVSSVKPSKPARVSSFISEEPLEPSKHKSERKEKRMRGKRREVSADTGKTYVEMNPPGSSASSYVQMAPSGTAQGARPAHTDRLQAESGNQPQRKSVTPDPLPMPPSNSHPPTSKGLQHPKSSSPLHNLPTQSVNALPEATQSGNQYRSKVHQQPKPPSQPLQPQTRIESATAEHSHSYELPKPPPLNQALPLPSHQVGSPSYALMGPKAMIDDPYCVMEVKDARPAAAYHQKPPSATEKQLMVDISDTTTIASTEATLQSASTGTGSSGDSNHTLQFDEPADSRPPPLDSPFSLYSKPLKIPKQVPCYIRQNSEDMRIFPSPSVPAACYIRSDSTLSHNSEFDVVSPNNSGSREGCQDAILESLANAQPEDLSAMLRREPMSPIRLPSVTSDTSTTTSYSRSNSDEMPCSAAELEWQQKKKLELVQEEKESCGGSKDGSAESFTGSKEGSASSGKDVGAKVPVKSYIRDDPKPTRVRKVPPNPAPPLPIRAISLDDKVGRLSMGNELVEVGVGPLNYVDIKHDKMCPSNAGTCASANSSSSPKATDSTVVAMLAAAAMTVPSVNYTTIDHDKTLELSKKGGNAAVPH